MLLNNNFVLYLLLLSLTICIYQLIILVVRYCKSLKFANCVSNRQQQFTNYAQQQQQQPPLHNESFENRQQSSTPGVNFGDHNGNLFRIRDDGVHQHQGHYNDIFYIDTANAEATRRRLQLESDDKDLPSYDEVMGLSSSSVPVALGANAVNVTPAGQSNPIVMIVPPMAPPAYAEPPPTAATVASVSSNPNQLSNPTATTSENCSAVSCTINAAAVKPIPSPTVN